MATNPYRNPAQRWKHGVPHDPRSIALFKSIAQIDWEMCNDYFCWKSGGDGDNGETFMYELDEHFQRLDEQPLPFNPELGYQLNDQKNQLMDELSDSLRVQLEGQSRHQLGNQLLNPLFQQLGTQLGNQLEEQL